MSRPPPRGRVTRKRAPGFAVAAGMTSALHGDARQLQIQSHLARLQQPSLTARGDDGEIAVLDIAVFLQIADLVDAPIPVQISF
jgi:hypothetical protein